MISVRYLLQISEEQEKLHANYNPFGQKYLKAVLSSKKVVNIDVVYVDDFLTALTVEVYFSDKGTMLDDKRIILHKNDDNYRWEKI